MSRLITPHAPSTGDNSSFLNVATEVPAADVEWNTAAGWQLRSQCPAGGEWCCGDTNMDPDTPNYKEDPGTVTPLQFAPFMAYQVAGCNAGTSRSPANVAEAQRSASDWMAANVDGWLSMAAEIGVCSNLGLTDLPDLSNPGGAGDLNVAISVMIRNRRNDGLYDRPTLHLPDWMAPILDDNVWVTRVVDVLLGSGYGIHPDVAAAPGEAWIYLTGDMEYSLGPILPASLTAPDLSVRRQNRTWEISEQMLAYRFDPCGSYKTLVTST